MKGKCHICSRTSLPRRVAAAIAAGGVLLSSCSVSKKLKEIRDDAPSAQIALSENISSAYTPVESSREADTLTIRSLDGKELVVMRVIRDDDGQMVANQVLEAAKVTARFRNIAERRGKVVLEFQIIVPPQLRSPRWQLRYQPTLFILEDSVKLDRVIVTGGDYRKRQLRGYQQYERFLRRIVSDTTHFINVGALEIFLRRNIPQLYAFKTDSSFVSDQQFRSAFGVSEAEAIRHYTDSFALERNRRRWNSRSSRFRRYVKAPLLTDGVRLDTVLLDENGNFIYNYVQTVETRPHLKKVDIVVDGEIYEQEKKLCLIGKSEPLNFYISSVSAFVDDSERYITKVIERNVQSSSSYQIDFKSGRYDIDLSLGENACKINEIKENLRSLLTNPVFALDSITVTSSASPEGSWRFNRTLSDKRSRSICRYFDNCLRHFEDSLRAENGFFVLVGDDMEEKVQSPDKKQIEHICFLSGSTGENWEKLDGLVEECRFLTDEDRKSYLSLARIPDPDRREEAMRARKWYTAMRAELYPRLRCVDFAFHLHRRGMVKDTVQTTELDTVYMAGIQAIKDRDYDRAIEILRPYQDYNTAVAYCAKEFNYSALSILEDCQKTAQVNYMTALIKSRLGKTREAVELYLQSCSQDPKFVHRGNLDPEISQLIRTYGLHEQLQKFITPF